MDALSEVLRLVRLTGAVFFDASMTAPWAIQVPPSNVIARAVLPEAEHLIEYHLVLEGRCYIAVADEPPLELNRGDLVMVPHGDAHRMSSEREPKIAPTVVDAIRMPRPGAIAAPCYGGGGELTRVACGYLAIDRRLCSALIDALPRVLRVDAASSDLTAWLQTYLRMRVERGEDQLGGACVLSKLSELMFVEAIRRYVEALPSGQASWLAGLKDPCVGRALGLLHREPTRDWTVDLLARDVGVSRSSLAERFAALVGKSPMQYLTHWRLALAAHLLRTTTRPASTVAFEVGYESENAFNRAFKREHGAPPAAWRRQRLQAATAVAASSDEALAATA
jgi:AraC-like DNA-binding protein